MISHPYPEKLRDKDVSGVDTEKEYEVQFDVTADGETKSVTNDLAKLSNTSYTTTIDTKTLFGSARRNAKAKVTVSLLPGPGGVQLWEGGPIWAECNIGAENPWEYGYYFWWGDTVGYMRNAANNGWVSADGNGTTIKFSDSDAKAKQTYGKNSDTLLNEGWIDASGNLAATHDAARVHLKGDWRMPTKDEIQQLVENCTTKWTTLNGVNGCIVTGKGEYVLKQIFLPAAGGAVSSDYGNYGSDGNYWSSTPVNTSKFRSSHIIALTQGTFGGNTHTRANGFVVRPVRDAE